jgi:sugar transferase (PEP-CTERM/EpsH1 system associated)
MNKPLDVAVRVMHIVYALRPGGMELGVVKLVNGLDPFRVQSAVCSTAPAGELRDLLAPRVRLFELQRRAGNDIALVWKLFRLFRRERPHIVHTHGWGTLLEGMAAARLASVPVVVHGEHGTLQLKRHQRWLQRRGWSAADQVLSVSSRLAERMAGDVGFEPARIRTIRNGVDLTRFNPAYRASARASLALAGEQFAVGTVGRLVPVKDQATLLEAVALLRREGLEVALVLAGDGPLEGALRDRAAALGITDSIRLLGHRRDVEVVLAALDVFALSSVSEGLSNTILEAMATGLPVIATRVGGADELVEDGVTGLLVAPGSPSDMSAALRRLLDPSARKAMGHAGRRRVEAEFALSTMVKRYEALYSELAAPRFAGAAMASASSPLTR